MRNKHRYLSTCRFGQGVTEIISPFVELRGLNGGFELFSVSFLLSRISLGFRAGHVEPFLLHLRSTSNVFPSSTYTLISGLGLHSWRAFQLFRYLLDCRQTHRASLREGRR